MIQGNTRLHITPLTPDLLRAIVPSSAVDLVENLSYHTIQTFPDNSYGYLELPSMEADKLKKKLNGAILRGKKIKIEEARPPKRRHGEDEPDHPEAVAVEATMENTSRRSKRSKKDPAVISGFELPAGRKVKRGWTEVKEDKAKRSKKEKPNRPSSKYSEKEEVLFRTKLPQNKKDPGKEEKKRKSGKMRDDSGDVVHEFRKSAIQPSFLRNIASSIDSKPAVKYVDSKGWVDEDGKIVEEEPITARLQKASGGGRIQPNSRAQESLCTDSTSSSEDTPKPVSRAGGIVSRLTEEEEEEADETSSAGSSSLASTETSEESDSNASGVSSGARDRDQSPNPETTIHPLEALFKKPSKPASQDIAKPSLELQTSFAFFDPNIQDDLEEDAQPVMPETPHGSQDVRSRGHRSAAPTPDTAHPTRYNSYTSQLTASDGEEEEPETPNRRSGRNQATPSKLSQQEVSQEQSAFEKQFWENRGELGRGWKRRRREVQKEKRRQENRAMRRPDW